MKTVEEVFEHARRLNLPELGRNFLATIWTSPPVRLTKSTWRSVAARFASWKMGRTIQAESHWVELSYIYLLELSSNVLGYLDQPARIKMPRLEAGGKWSAFDQAQVSRRFPELSRNFAHVLPCSDFRDRN